MFENELTVIIPAKPFNRGYNVQQSSADTASKTPVRPTLMLGKNKINLFSMSIIIEMIQIPTFDSSKPIRHKHYLYLGQFMRIRIRVPQNVDVRRAILDLSVPRSRPYSHYGRPSFWWENIWNRNKISGREQRIWKSRTARTARMSTTCGDLIRIPIPPILGG